MTLVVLNPWGSSHHRIDKNTKEEILSKAQEWFKSEITDRHILNTQKLKLSSFQINPFLLSYLSNFLEGNSDARSKAKVLLLPRVLGTSINTSFGNAIQKFTSEVLDGYGSSTSGIDIEFIDQLDGRRKYCQIKSGPNTINKDDVTTISGHFKGIKNLARTNNLDIRFDDLIVGIVYGEPSDLSGHYKALDQNYPVIIGKEFWLRITGDNMFYQDLINEVGKVAQQADFKAELEEVIELLSNEISDLESSDSV